MSTTTCTGQIQNVSAFQLSALEPFNTPFSGQPNLQFRLSMPSTDVNNCWFNTYTLSTSPTTVDVSSLTGAFGESINFTTVKQLTVVNRSATTGVVVGGGSTPLVDEMPELTGSLSCIYLTANLTTSGANLLSLVCSSGTAVTDVLIAGFSS